MEAKVLIQLLNFSRTLIQDGEIQFLYYEKFPVHPEDIGADHQDMMAMWERQLRENPPKSENPKGLRKVILGYLEDEKKYGGFRDENAAFLEAHVVFQNFLPGKQVPRFHYAYRVECIRRSENYPSLGHSLFFSAGEHHTVFSNGPDKVLVNRIPNQFSNGELRGHLIGEKGHVESVVIDVTYLPPSNPIEDNPIAIDLSKTDIGETVYIITHRPFERGKAKIYVRLRDGLPEVFREEFYYQSDSPHTDAEGYWLRQIKMYRDFERVATVNIAFPKVREIQEFRDVDGFMRTHTIATIKELGFLTLARFM